jgi:hypothetical protein
MNHKTDNKYFVKIPQRFIEDFNIDWEKLFLSIQKYIISKYLQNKSKTFKVNIQDENLSTIIFHKIELSENNKSSKKSKRVLIFILLNKPNWINTIVPVFSFSTQEEKKYTTKLLHTKDFIYKTLRNFWKYKSWLDFYWKELSEWLWKEIKY